LYRVIKTYRKRRADCLEILKKSRFSNQNVIELKQTGEADALVAELPLKEPRFQGVNAGEMNKR
jgi:hypothetical protein